jgi:small subunit ribosomal protein S9|tara:strand:- start:607 stop:1008 length:402 start_codon:yes stop_codon:yes gene_type:complete
MVNSKNQKWIATGRRKSSIARVELKAGKGQFLVNGRDFNEYFNRDTQKMVIKRPFEILELNNQYDVSVNVTGGGSTGQAGAVRLGISRVLEKINADFRSTLKANGMLTRDSRKVERKKYGQPGARKKFQFSKR